MEPRKIVSIGIHTPFTIKMTFVHGSGKSHCYDMENIGHWRQAHGLEGMPLAQELSELDRTIRSLFSFDGIERKVYEGTQKNPGKEITMQDFINLIHLYFETL